MTDVLEPRKCEACPVVFTRTNLHGSDPRYCLEHQYLRDGMSE